MRKASLKNGIASKLGHDKKSSIGPMLTESKIIKTKKSSSSKKLNNAPSQTRFMAYQDEIVNRRQKEEIVHAKHVLLNGKKKQEAMKTFSS